MKNVIHVLCVKDHISKLKNEEVFIISIMSTLKDRKDVVWGKNKRTSKGYTNEENYTASIHEIQL